VIIHSAALEALSTFLRMRKRRRPLRKGRKKLCWKQGATGYVKFGVTDKVSGTYSRKRREGIKKKRGEN